MEGIELAAWLSKPILYWGIYAIANVWWAGRLPKSRWRPLFAALTRFGAGILIGVPFASLLRDMDVTSITIAFSLFRFALWAGVTWLFFRRAPLGQVLALAVGATLLNWGVDFIVYRGHWANIRAFTGC